MTIDEKTLAPVADLGQFLVVAQCAGDPIPTHIEQFSTLMQARNYEEKIRKECPIAPTKPRPDYFVLDDEGKRV